MLSKGEKYTSVEQNVWLDSPDGKRQFDVVIHAKVAGIDFTNSGRSVEIIKAKLNVTHLDGLHSKQRDVNAHKAVLVSRNGFYWEGH